MKFELTIIKVWFSTKPSATNVICVDGYFRLQGRESDSFFFTIRDTLNVLLEVSEPKFSVYLLKY